MKIPSSRSASRPLSPQNADTMVKSARRSKIILLDGGLGTELKRRNAFPNLADYTTLWSAAPLLTAEGREHIVQAHLAYILAGVDVITTNTYACTRDILSKRELCHRLVELISVACDLAIEARRRSGKSSEEVRIAGSIPPLCTTYRPDLVYDRATMDTQYQEICQALAPKVDIMLCETMSSIEEALAAASAARAMAPNLPVWVAGCVVAPTETVQTKSNSTELLSGESVEAFLTQIDAFSDAILFNCATPEAISSALAIATNMGVTASLGAYANHFDPVPKGWTLDGPGSEDGATLLSIREMGIQDYGSYANTWLELEQVNIIGGCCGISPEHIKHIHDTLNNDGTHPHTHTRPLDVNHLHPTTCTHTTTTTPVVKVSL